MLCRRGVERMIPVVLEPSCRDPRGWRGVVGGKLGGTLYTDLSANDGDGWTNAIEQLDENLRAVTEAERVESDPVATTAAAAATTPPTAKERASGAVAPAAAQAQQAANPRADVAPPSAPATEPATAMATAVTLARAEAEQPVAPPPAALAEPPPAAEPSPMLALHPHLPTRKIFVASIADAEEEEALKLKRVGSGLRSGAEVAERIAPSGDVRAKEMGLEALFKRAGVVWNAAIRDVALAFCDAQGMESMSVVAIAEDDESVEAFLSELKLPVVANRKLRAALVKMYNESRPWYQRWWRNTKGVIRGGAKSAV